MRLAARQVVVLPGLGEWIGEVLEVIGAIEPTSLVRMEFGILHAVVVDRKGDGEQCHDDDGVDCPLGVTGPV